MIKAPHFTLAEANVEWGVLYNITTFSRLTTVLSQLPDCLLTNHKDTKTQRKKRRSLIIISLALII